MAWQSAVILAFYWTGTMGSVLLTVSNGVQAARVSSIDYYISQHGRPDTYTSRSIRFQSSKCQAKLIFALARAQPDSKTTVSANQLSQGLQLYKGNHQWWYGSPRSIVHALYNCSSSTMRAT